MQLHLRAHAPCPSSIGRGSAKPAPCLHLRPRRVCRAWDSEETAARWQELPDVRQPSIQDQGPSSSLLPADPQATLQRVLEVVRTGNLDGMLEFCSDEVIDKLLALKQTPGCLEEQVHFRDILKANSDDLLQLDTFAVRNLIMTAPHSVRVLSAMQVTPEKYLQRCSIVAPSGEECVLTFNVVLQQALECQYKSVLVSKKWMLKGVSGECNSDELPSHPSPSFPPEAVVEAQLAALREGRVAPVFAHASPENKASTGPVERFAFMLQHHPAYAPLMGHIHAETVQRLQPSESTYMEVVKVTPRVQPASTADGGSTLSSLTQQGQQAGEPVLFMWIVSRQPSSSMWSGCWMADAIQMVNVMPAQPPSSSGQPSDIL